MANRLPLPAEVNLAVVEWNNMPSNIDAGYTLYSGLAFTAPGSESFTLSGGAYTNSRSGTSTTDAACLTFTKHHFSVTLGAC